MFLKMPVKMEIMAVRNKVGTFLGSFLDQYYSIQVLHTHLSNLYQKIKPIENKWLKSSSFA